MSESAGNENGKRKNGTEQTIDSISLSPSTSLIEETPHLQQTLIEETASLEQSKYEEMIQKLNEKSSREDVLAALSRCKTPYDIGNPHGRCGR